MKLILGIIRVMYIYRHDSDPHATLAKSDQIRISKPVNYIHNPHCFIYCFQTGSYLSFSFMHPHIFGAFENLTSSLFYMHVVRAHSLVSKFLLIPTFLTPLCCQSNPHWILILHRTHAMHVFISLLLIDMIWLFRRLNELLANLVALFLHISTRTHWLSF